MTARSALMPFPARLKTELKLDPVMLGLVLVLLLGGFVILASASITISDNATGNPFFYLERQLVAAAIGLPMNKVRVAKRRMGGGFGGKESQGNALAVACAVAAQLPGQPCKMRYDRDDDMVITGKRHDFQITYTAGFDDEGVLRGVDFTQMTRCGWALDLSIPDPRLDESSLVHAYGRG